MNETSRSKRLKLMELCVVNLARWLDPTAVTLTLVLQLCFWFLQYPPEAPKEDKSEENDNSRHS